MNMEYDTDYKSNDPSTWSISHGLANMWQSRMNDDPQEVIMDWWQDLSDRDERIHEEFGPERFGILRDLVEQYDGVRGEYTDTVQDQQALKQVYYNMLKHGLTTTQIGILTGRGREDVVRSLVANRTLSVDELERRCTAETLLREGLTVVSVVEQTDLPEHVVTQWAKSLQITPTPSGNSLEYGRFAREQAYRMFDSGASVDDIVDALNVQYPERTFTKVAVHKWMSRRRLGK